MHFVRAVPGSHDCALMLTVTFLHFCRKTCGFIIANSSHFGSVDSLQPGAKRPLCPRGVKRALRGMATVAAVEFAKLAHVCSLRRMRKTAGAVMFCIAANGTVPALSLLSREKTRQKFGTDLQAAKLCDESLVSLKPRH